MKKRFISERYVNMKANAMGQSDIMAKSFSDVINLSLGDPDLVTHESIIQAAFEDAARGYTGYSDFSGDPELREAVCKYYKEEYSMEVTDEEVFICSSATVGMHLALEAVLDDGDEVILQAPFFTPYPDQVILSRGVPVELATYEEEDFQINIQRLESLITPRTKALVIYTPSNPTGSCLSEETMKGIARVAEKYDILVIADDIYTDYSYQNPFVPFASLPGMFERTVTLNSFSKGFNMTGWRVGNIIAPAHIIKVIKHINENVCFTTPSISRKEIQPPIISEYKKRVYYAAERINSLGKMSVIYPPKGTFYLFPNIKKTGLSSEEVSEAILKEAHVLVLPGNAFGECGEGYIRIACTSGIEKLKEAFDRIEKMEIFR